MINHFLRAKMQLLLEKFQQNLYLSEPSIINVEKFKSSSDYPSKIFLWSIIIDTQFLFLSNTLKYNFLLDHNYETKSESSDSVAFVKIV